MIVPDVASVVAATYVTRAAELREEAKELREAESHHEANEKIRWAILLEHAAERELEDADRWRKPE